MVEASVIETGDAEGLADTMRRAMANCGYTDLKSFQKADLMVTP